MTITKRHPPHLQNRSAKDCAIAVALIGAQQGR
jgi:hypothetical protein